MSLCTVTNIVQSAANVPGGGGPGASSQAVGVLYQVTAELRGYDNPPNDGIAPVTQVFKGTVVQQPVIITGFVAGFRDPVAYSIQVPFIDQLFQGSSPLTAPFSVYYQIVERYLLNFFPVQQGTGQADRFQIVRKIRPLSSGGAAQTVSSILV